MSNRDRLRDEYESNQDALGVTAERQDFFDDANAALGLGYSASLMEAGRSKTRLAAIDAEHDNAVKDLLEKAQQNPKLLDAPNKGAARHYAMLRNEGYDHDTAMEMTANSEYEAQDDHSAYEPDGNHITARDLMPGYSISKGGGGKAKAAKKILKPVVGKCHNCHQGYTADIYVCQNCGAEVIRRRGRPDEGGRSTFMGIRVTKETHQFLLSDDAPASAGEMVEMMTAAMVETGFTIDQMRAVFEGLTTEYREAS